MHFRNAIVRIPAGTLTDGLTSSGELGPPSKALTLRQHRDYVSLLHNLGLAVEILEAQPDFPDAHFIEDTAVVTPEVAIITRPGANSRRDEILTVAPVLKKHRRIEWISSPGTLDGGDILVVDKDVFIGISQRTNPEGAAQLDGIMGPLGYRTWQIPVGEGLHLKSGVNVVGKNTLLLTPTLEHHEAFSGYERIVLRDADTYAANTLWINDTLLMPSGYPDARRQLERLHLPVLEVDVSEFRKMDGGLTCLSLRF